MTILKCCYFVYKSRPAFLLAAARNPPQTCLVRATLRLSSSFASSFSAIPRPPSSHDDRLIQDIFDKPDIWLQYSARSRGTRFQRDNAASCGLIKNKNFRSPESLLDYAVHTTIKCQRLVDMCLAASTPQEFSQLIRRFDLLSDYICRVTDFSDFIRVVHPSLAYQRMAKQAHLVMYDYMNTLNTNAHLHKVLQQAVDTTVVYASWSAEEQAFAHILLKDFAGLHSSRSEIDRKQYVRLMNDVLEAGDNLTDKSGYQDALVSFSIHELEGLPSAFFKANFTAFQKSLCVPCGSSTSFFIIANAHNPRTRHKMLLANRSASSKTVSYLHQMLLARSQLAKLSNCASFAHMALSSKLARSPEVVTSFLNSLAQGTGPLAQHEIQQLLVLKSKDSLAEPPTNVINSWDKDYYVKKLKEDEKSQATHDVSQATISHYFSLGTVMRGLSRVSENLYGLRLVPRETLPGEIWHEDVRRLDVVNEENQVIGVIYCDLFARQGKLPDACHFTLRCSRTLLPLEIASYINMESPDDFSTDPYPDAVSAATEGVPYSNDIATGLIRQHPIIALTCDFEKGNTSTFLNLEEVKTMFHEMGHALHSLLAQRDLQGVSGTRCATDMAEVPSMLMERFALSKDVLPTWARHYQTGQPISPDLVDLHLNLRRNATQALDTEEQILLSQLDQELHSKLWTQEGSIACQSDKLRLDSTAVYHYLSSRTSIPDIMGSSKHAFSGHLYSYGATYYSYLFSQCVAGQIWRQVFEQGAQAGDRRAGEKFRADFLCHGGSKNGWHCIADLLDDSRLRLGGTEAMEIVGSWGVW